MKEATRRINKFDFSGEGAHVALVDRAANEQTVLVMKASEQMVDAYNPDSITISKALEQVEIKLSMEEFLRKFFDMWYSDAEMLTKLLGFETEFEAMEKENNGEGLTHSGYLEQRLESFSIMKSLFDSDDSPQINLSDFINIVKTQESFENNTLNKTEGKQPMTEKVIEKAEEVVVAEEAVITKSDLEAIRKSLADLQKRNEALESEKEEVLVKALEAKVADFSFVEDKEGVVALAKQMDEKAQEVLFKSFDAANKALEEAIATPMSIEGEVILKSDGAVEDAKAVLDAQIAKKYKLGA